MAPKKMLRRRGNPTLTGFNIALNMASPEKRFVVVDVFHDAISFSVKMPMVGIDIKKEGPAVQAIATAIGYVVSYRDHRTPAQRRAPKLKPGVAFTPGAVPQASRRYK